MKKFYFLLIALIACVCANASTAYYENTKGWSKVKAYWWNGDAEKCSWPGKDMANQGTKWFIEIQGTPEMIIFNNGSGAQTGDLPFVDGATYDFDGQKGVVYPTWTAQFDDSESGWGEVYCYTFNAVCTGGWPGTKMTAKGNNIFAIEFKAAEAPAKIIFNNGQDGEGKAQTKDLDFVNGKTYNVNSEGTDPDFGGDDPDQPEEPGEEGAVVKLMGLDGDWANGIEEAVVADTNCATFVVENWAEGTGFKFIDTKGNWWGYTGEIENGKWYTMADTGMDNTVLPAAATGKTVTLVFANDNHNFSASWEAEGGDEPEQPEEPGEEGAVVKLMGLDGDWANGIEEAVVADTNCATFVVENWAEGTGFKFIDTKGNWWGYTGEIENGKWYTMADTGMDNTVLPASATGKTVTLVFANDNHNFSASWEAEGGEEPGEEGDYVVYFDNANTNYETVYAYVYNADGSAYVAAWPGEECVLVSGTTYKYEFSWSDTPAFVIFNNGNGEQTADFGFENGKTYTTAAAGEVTSYTVSYDDTETGWGVVYAYAWNGGTNVLGSWPGKEMTKGEGNLFTITFESAVEPESIIFNNGGNGGQTADLEFVNGKTYGVVDPSEPQKVVLTGAFVSWSQTAHVAEVNAETNCATFVVENYVNEVEGQGAGVKFIYAGSWFGFGNEVESGEWYSAESAADADNINLPDADGKTVTFVFAVDACTFSISWEASGVANIEANDAAPVYYNLQGVRVAEPANGLYIVVRGNKVAKEIVR